MGRVPDKITNRVFLEAMFEEALPGTHTIICAFSGDPLTAPRSAWAGFAWQPGDAVPNWFDRSNSYLTVSVFEPDAASGKRRRRKADFQAMQAVMVDDVGTKIATEKLALRSSAVIETSPQNFQAYYFLKQDSESRDRDTCELLVNRMVASGLTADSCDPGMKGVTRYGRLPTGVNCKKKYVQLLGGAFPVRCIAFNPVLRYSISEIAVAFQLDMTPERPRPPVIKLSAVQTKDASEKFGELLHALEFMGMYRGHRHWHDILCPWVHEHTSFAETGTAIAEPSAENNYAGGFKCHHGHCQHRTMRDVWAWARALGRLLRAQR